MFLHMSWHNLNYFFYYTHNYIEICLYMLAYVSIQMIFFSSKIHIMYKSYFFLVKFMKFVSLDLNVLLSWTLCPLPNCDELDLYAVATTGHFW